MEHITPQYRRGKYIDRRNRKKRIVIICLCAAVVIAATVLLILFWDDIFHSGDAAAGDAAGASQSASIPTEKSDVVPTQTVSASEEQLSGSSVTLADGRLLLTYDSEALTLLSGAEVTTLLDNASGAETPRMDLQPLPGKLGMLRDSEKERIAIALMQAYYYHPPHTEDVQLTVNLNDEYEFSATMQLPSIDDAPAAVCSVRLLAVGDALWAAVLLQPEGIESAALTNSFDWLTLTEENG